MFLECCFCLPGWSLGVCCWTCSIFQGGWHHRLLHLVRGQRRQNAKVPNWASLSLWGNIKTQQNVQNTKKTTSQKRRHKNPKSNPDPYSTKIPNSKKPKVKHGKTVLQSSRSCLSLPTIFLLPGNRRRAGLPGNQGFPALRHRPRTFSEVLHPILGGSKIPFFFWKRPIIYLYLPMNLWFMRWNLLLKPWWSSSSCIRLHQFSHRVLFVGHHLIHFFPWCYMTLPHFCGWRMVTPIYLTMFYIVQLGESGATNVGTPSPSGHGWWLRADSKDPWPHAADKPETAALSLRSHSLELHDVDQTLEMPAISYSWYQPSEVQNIDKL